MQKKRPELPAVADESPARLPGVSRLLAGPACAPLIARFGSALITGLLREHVARLRAALIDGSLTGSALDRAVLESSIAEAVEGEAERLVAPRPQRVINATGVVVHTNLGRSTLSQRAAEQLAIASRSYLDLEYDVEAGRRGNRLAALDPLMSRLFPGYRFTVVNNNAAAVLMCASVFGRGREVLVSRGELVEIGGSFRIPDVLTASGARLKEVGTTNRTRLADYECALTAETGLILKVHTSNFEIVGFTEAVTVEELARLASQRSVPLLVDWGSGDLVDLGPLGIADEWPVSRVLRDGADLVSFSGDKLLGGPQCGFVVGRAELIERVRRDPLARACRLDRLRLGALQQTLVSYVTGRAFEEIPTLSMLAAEPAALDRRARALREEVARRSGAGQWLAVVEGVSRTGGGSSPAGERPTRLLAVALPGGDAAGLERRLRAGTPPIVGRMSEGRLLLDLRTVLPDEQPLLAERLAEALVAELGAAPP